MNVTQLNIVCCAAESSAELMQCRESVRKKNAANGDREVARPGRIRWGDSAHSDYGLITYSYIDRWIFFQGNGYFRRRTIYIKG